MNHQWKIKQTDNITIDLHVHVFPEAMFKAIWNYFESGGWPVHHEFAENIEQTLKKHGIDRAVALSYPHKTDVAASLNKFMVSCSGNQKAIGDREAGSSQFDQVGTFTTDSLEGGFGCIDWDE